MIYLLPAFFAFFLAFFLTKGALKFFPRLGLLDRPAKYGLKRDPIPYYGGLILFITFFVSVLFFVPLNTQLIGFLLGCFIITAMSFFDDLYNLSPKIRLFIQFIAAFILVIFGVKVTSISNPFGAPFSLDIFTFHLDQIYQLSLISTLFTILWVISIVNTMNFLDGLNGLPSGVTVIAALTLFLLSIRPGIHSHPDLQVSVAVMSIILFAASFAFWIFDFYPAKILMGDTGSMFLGFVLAVLAIFSGGKIATAFLVLGVPILDACWVILRRISEGKSPLHGDYKHFHHRLLALGFSDRKALFCIYILCAIFGGVAVVLEGKQKVYAIFALFLLMVILAVIAVYSIRKKDPIEKI